MLIYAFYTNIRHLLSYRGYNVTTGLFPESQLSSNTKHVRNLDYIAIEATPGDRIRGFRKNNLTAVLITNTKTTMSEINKLRDVLRKANHDLLVFADISIKLMESGKSQSRYEELLEFKYIAENKGVNVQCMPHRVMAPSERNALNFHGGVNPMIGTLDVMNVWAGGRPGELIEVKFTSELAHIPIEYYQVVNKSA